MNKLFESERKISTFRDLKDLATGDKLIGRREIIIAIDENAIQELKSYVYKSEMYDELRTELLIKDNNWNELKKYINKMIEKDKKYTDIASRYGVLNCKSILVKIKKLEGKNEKQN